MLLSPQLFINKINEISAEEKNKKHSKYEENTTVDEYIDTLKEKLNVFNSRLQRYKKSKEDNQKFQINEKQYYRKIAKKDETSKNEVPTREEIEKYWSGMWSEVTTRRRDAGWIEREERKMENRQIGRMDDHLVSTAELESRRK